MENSTTLMSRDDRVLIGYRGTYSDVVDNDYDHRKYPQEDGALGKAFYLTDNFVEYVFISFFFGYPGDLFCSTRNEEILDPEWMVCAFYIKAPRWAEIPKVRLHPNSIPSCYSPMAIVDCLSPQ